MNKYLFLFLVGYLINFQLYAQTTLSGYVYDSQSREPLIGATIFDSLSQTGTTANEFGYYRLFLKKQNVSLRISYVGYQTQTLALASLTQDTTINILLTPSVSLAILTVVANKDNNIETIQPGKVNIALERLKGIPSVGGEKIYSKLFLFCRVWRMVRKGLQAYWYVAAVKTKINLYWMGQRSITQGIY